MSGIKTIKRNWNPFRDALQAKSFGELNGIYRAWLVQTFADFANEYPGFSIEGAELKTETDGSYTLVVYGLKHVPLKDEAGNVIGTAEVVKVDDGEQVTGRVTITDPELAKEIMDPLGFFSIKE